MEKVYTSLGLMSGTSMDGVDISIIRSNGEDNYVPLFDEFFEYDEEIHRNLINLRDKIKSSKDMDNNFASINEIERKITLFHAAITKKITEDKSIEIDLVGFHGQTIFHNAGQKISKQLGDGALLSRLLKKRVVYKFRENDILNGGEGAPLAPIFHNLLVNQNAIELPVCILNIGGIANITILSSKKNEDLKSYDIGPGNCLLDEWVRKHTNKRYDKNGEIANIGKTNQIILNHAINNFDNIQNKNNLSFDIKDFDLSFVRSLSFEDGLSTLTDFTATIIYRSIFNSIKFNTNKKLKILTCGGGRKNLSLINSIKKKLPNNISLMLIDNYKINGDFIESQAFAFLAIRSLLGKTISFPKTTNVSKPCTGGVLIENY